MIWDSESYWQKAKAYMILATQSDREAWERSFWRALGLEFLLRSALTKVHPALNADPQNEGVNLLYAFGISIKGEPRSIPIHAVTARLEKIVEKFQKPQREFCDYLMLKRNEECHTCESPFEAMAESKWLPSFYEVCEVLNEHLEKDLQLFLGDAEAATAKQLILAKNTQKRGDVLKKINSHGAVFKGKDPAQKEDLERRQEIASEAWYFDSTAVKCPACGALAKLSGDLERESEPMYRDGELVVEKTFLATNLSCGACELELRDIEELHAAGVEPHFSALVHTSLHEFYEPEEYDPYMNM